jgi:hypothetical protein
MQLDQFYTNILKELAVNSNKAVKKDVKAWLALILHWL